MMRIKNLILTSVSVSLLLAFLTVIRDSKFLFVIMPLFVGLIGLKKCAILSSIVVIDELYSLLVNWKAYYEFSRGLIHSAIQGIEIILSSLMDKNVFLFVDNELLYMTMFILMLLCGNLIQFFLSYNALKKVGFYRRLNAIVGVI